jgi:hypothetical protein
MNKMIIASLVLLGAGVHPGLAAAMRLPPEVAAKMRSGHRISKLWVSPEFKAAQGFRTGQVDSYVTSPYADITGDFPAAFSRLTRPESPNVLSLTLVELTVRERPQNNYLAATVGIEGRVTDPDGKLVMAFAARQESSSGAGVPNNCRRAVDTIVAALAGELGMPLRKAAPVKPKPVAPAEPQASAPRPEVIPAPAPVAVKAAAPQAPSTPALAGTPDADPVAHGHHY